MKMLRIVLTAFLSLVSISAQAQWAAKAVPVQAWQPGNLFEPSLIQQVRFPRGTYSVAPQFNGSPAVTITGGTIAGSIVDSRTGDGSTFQPPFFVQVSASGITATGTSAPYEDLSYSWNFGEGCGDAFIRPTDGASVCSGTDQRGPEAAYAYRTSGTKTVTLTVTGSNGTCNSAGICQTVTPYVVTKSWTVNAWSPTQTYYFNSAAGGTNAGTQANPFNTMSALLTAMRANPSNTQVYFAKGMSYAGSAGIYLCAFPSSDVALTGVRFGTIAGFGAGADPIIEVTSGTEIPLSISTGTSSSVCNQRDIVFSNITFKNSGVDGLAGGGAASVGTGGNATNTIKNLYFDNVNFNMTFDSNTPYAQVLLLPTPGFSTGTSLSSNIGLWNVTTTNPTNSTTIGLGEDGTSENWYFKMGGSVTGASTVATGGDHHIYDEVKNHGLFQWVTCGPTGTGTHKRTYCFNGNWDGIRNDPSDHVIAQYRAWIENSCQYTALCIDLGNASNNTSPSDSTVQFQYVVIASNAMIGMGGDIEQFGNGLSVTMRDNRVWGAISTGDGAGFFVPTTGQLASVAQNTHLLSKSYRNKNYIPSGSDTENVFQFTTGANWSSPQVIVYNTTVDARAFGQAIALISADWTAAGSTVNYNVYSSPSSDLDIWFNNSTARTFAQWQALGWDLNGTNLGSACPSGWTCPPTTWSHMGP